MDIESYDRLFAAQDYLPRRGFGNLIALPLEGRCRQSRTTLFVDPATFEPYQDRCGRVSSGAHASARKDLRPGYRDLWRYVPQVRAPIMVAGKAVPMMVRR
jgi:hypothetical protein